MIELPYRSSDISMVIIASAPGQAAVSSILSQASELKDSMNQLKQTQVHLSLPKFHFNWDDDALLARLKKRGFPIKGFDGGFSPEQARNIELTTFVQKTLIRVDEQGTEAVAATGASAGVTAMPPAPTAAVELVIDHPFYFLIRDRMTNTPLFMGYVANPTQN